MIRQTHYIFIAITAFIIVSAFTFSVPGKTGLPENLPPSLSGSQAKWTLDKAHSSIRFSVRHLMISESEGEFKTFEGSMQNTGKDFTDADINFTVDANSIDTDNEDRNTHLKSESFFNTAKYPSISFESTSFKTAGGKKYRLMGKLTIKDITKNVVFDVIYSGSKDAEKGTTAVFKATTVVNRDDYNLKLDNMDAIVGKDVSVTVNVQMNEVR